MTVVSVTAGQGASSWWHCHAGEQRAIGRPGDLAIDPALIILATQRSGTADAGRSRGSAAAVWTGCAYAGPRLASAVPCGAPAPGADPISRGPAGSRIVRKSSPVSIDQTRTVLSSDAVTAKHP